MSSRPDLRLDWCSYAAAKYAVEHWHYSKKMPKTKLARLGVWENKKFIGAIVFSCGSGGATDGRRYGLAKRFEVAELQRVALSAHQTPVSRLLSIALAMIHHAMPNLRAIVSYADPNEGHYGGIYQASNWLYLGQTPRGVEHRLTDGRWAHNRIVHRQHGKFTLAHWLQTGESRHIPGKWKYIWPFTLELRDRLQLLDQPYPKRPKDSSEPPVIHTGEGGAAPTRTLQNLFPLRERFN